MASEDVKFHRCQVPNTLETAEVLDPFVLQEFGFIVREHFSYVHN